MKKPIKITLLFILLLVLSGYLFAQEDSIQKPIKLKKGFYEDASYIIGNFSRLNDILIQNGFPELEQTYGGFSFGFSARPSNKDSYFTAKIFILSTRSTYYSNNATKGASILSYGLHDEWHLDFVKNRKWRIGPDFGFGFGLLRLKIFERLSTPVNFTATLNPSIITYHEKKLYSPSLFANAGLGIDRKVKLKVMDFYVGIGAGYWLNTPAGFSEKYQYNISSPRVRLSGIFYAFKFRFEIRELIPSKKSGYEYRKFY